MLNTAADDWPRRVAILGVGLLGGSVALAIRRARPSAVLVGYARSADKRELATAEGVVDEAYDSIEAACRDCDVVVVAAPVDRIAAMAVQAAQATPGDCLITDVGSTKARIVAEVSEHPLAAKKFVAAHPIAGSEKSGCQHASASLFDQKVVVLTPSESSEANLLGKADHFWRMTGAVTRQMSPAEHDTHLASVSHVPHLVSALVAKMTRPEARSLAGSGWQDITRVAAGDPGMWTAICQENRAAIAAELLRLATELEGLRQLVAGGDDEGLMRWLAAAKEVKQRTK